MPSGPDNEIQWYKPDPRAIIPLDNFHTSKSLKKFLKKTNYVVTVDQDFSAVILGCADRAETWITSEIIKCYTELYDLGHAHSIEVWQDSKLVGGLYGIAIGRAFFAESMFSRAQNASKVALRQLVALLNAKKFQLLEVQFLTTHLASLGAVQISDDDYAERLKKALTGPTSPV